ncbi:hypothetical protein V501_03056, partial [Pseudogymnoascus sp. VKM F-4519 (FW-2642)]
MVLNCIIEEEDVESRVREIIQSKFEIKKAGAAKELETLIKDEKRQPITYNHYYTDNVQNARHDAMKGNIQKAMQSVVEHDQNGKLQALHTLPPPARSTETSAPPGSALSSTPLLAASGRGRLGSTIGPNPLSVSFPAQLGLAGVKNPPRDGLVSGGVNISGTGLPNGDLDLFGLRLGAGVP